MARNSYAMLETGRELAAMRRGRGLPGAAHESWIAKPSNYQAPEGFDLVRIRAKQSLREWRDSVLLDYQRAAFPERFEDDGFDIPTTR